MGLNLFEHSFGDGNLVHTIEINTSEEINELNSNESLINFFLDEKKKIYSYRLVFKNRNELIAFESSIKKDNRLISVRVDMQS